MALLMTEERATVTWYNPSYGASRYPIFEQRAQKFIQRGWNGKILIAGCGFGHTIDELVRAGIDAWGCDAAAYAINLGKSWFPSIASRLILADCLNQDQMDDVRRAAGLTVHTNPGKNQKFNVVITEDMISCLTDGEVQACLPIMRRTGNIVVHLVTPGVVGDPALADPEINWKTLAQWKAVVGSDFVIDPNSEVVI